MATGTRRLKGWDYYPLGDRCFQGPLRWAMRSGGWTPMLAAHAPWLLPLRLPVGQLLRSSTYCQVMVDMIAQRPRAFLVSYLHPVDADTRTLRIQRLLWPDQPPSVDEVKDALWRCTAAAMSLSARHLEIEVATPDAHPVHPQSLNVLGVAHEPGAYGLYGDCGMMLCASSSYSALDNEGLRKLSELEAARPERLEDWERQYDQAWNAYAHRYLGDDAYAAQASRAARAVGLVVPFLAATRCVRIWRAEAGRYLTYCIPEIVQGTPPASRLERGHAARLLKVLPLDGDDDVSDIRRVLAGLARELLREGPSVPLLLVGPVPETDVTLHAALEQLGFESSGSLQILRREIG